MAFANTDSILAADVNSMLRGLFRDHSSNSHTGDTNETTLTSTSITGGTIGSTGTLVISAAGDITNSASGAKTIKLKFGATTLATISRTGANAQDWQIFITMSSSSTTSHRAMVLSSVTDAITIQGDSIQPTDDSSGALTLAVTAELANGSDTIRIFSLDVLVMQTA